MSPFTYHAFLLCILQQLVFQVFFFVFVYVTVVGHAIARTNFGIASFVGVRIVWFKVIKKCP